MTKQMKLALYGFFFLLLLTALLVVGERRYSLSRVSSQSATEVSQNQRGVGSVSTGSAKTVPQSKTDVTTTSEEAKIPRDEMKDVRVETTGKETVDAKTDVSGTEPRIGVTVSQDQRDLDPQKMQEGAEMSQAQMDLMKKREEVLLRSEEVGDVGVKATRKAAVQPQSDPVISDREPGATDYQNPRPFDSTQTDKIENRSAVSQAQIDLMKKREEARIRRDEMLAVREETLRKLGPGNTGEQQTGQ